MKKRTSAEPYTERPVRLLLFGDSPRARAIFPRLLQEADDRNDLAVNLVFVREKFSEASEAPVYPVTVHEPKGDRIVKINCVSGFLDPAEDDRALTALAESSDLTHLIFMPEAPAWRLPDGKMSREKDHLLARLTSFLFRRFCMEKRGFVCYYPAMIEENGRVLKEEIAEYAVASGLDMDFVNWLCLENTFINSCLDCLTPEKDAVACEGYCWFYEDQPDGLFNEVGIARVTEDLRSCFFLEKRLKQAALCTSAAYALLHNVETVRDFLTRQKLARHMSVAVYEEIIPTLDVNFETVQVYTMDLMNRLANPGLRIFWKDHVTDLAGKFAETVWPSLKAFYESRGETPKHLVFSLFCVLKFYQLDLLFDRYTERIQKASVEEVLADTSLWGEDLSFLAPEITAYEARLENA